MNGLKLKRQTYFIERVGPHRLGSWRVDQLVVQCNAEQEREYQDGENKRNTTEIAQGVIRIRGTARQPGQCKDEWS